MDVSTRWRRLGTAARALSAARRLAAQTTCGPEALQARQRERLLDLLRHAARHSPYYRDRLGGLSLDADLDVTALPTLDKQTLLEHFDAIVTDPRLRRDDLERHVAGVTGDELYLGEYRVLCTGGTSGVRGLFVYSRRDWHEALGGMLRHMTGFLGLAPRWPRRRRIAVVAALSPLHMTARMGASVDVGLHRMLRLDARSPLAGLTARLDEFQPEALLAYPSIAALLADEQLAGRLCIAPRVVVTSSEVRTAEMARRIASAWAVTPFDLYATTETGILAADCERHEGLHLFSDQTLLEVVDEQGRPVPEDSPGARILVTSLVNRSQPLIRLEITDLVTLSSRRCSCGRPFPLLGAVDGRSDDVLRLPAAAGGTVAVHPLAIRSPFAKLAGLQQYRVILEPARLLVEVVARDDDAEVEARVTTTLQAALLAQGVLPPRIEVQRRTAIERHGQSGKAKLIESRLARSP